MWINLQKAMIITRREVRDQFRDWRIITPIIILTVFFPGLMNFTAQQAVDFVSKYGAAIIADRLIPFLLMVVGFFPISVSLVIALESFVGEKERRSIEPLLSSPLTDVQLYLGKLMAVMFPPLIGSYLGISVYLIGVFRQVGWVPDTTLLIQVIALATVQSLVMVSGAVVVSSQTTSVRAANLLASFIIIPMALLLVGESMIMFWARYEVLWWAIFGQAIIAWLLIRTGIAHFNREELLGIELDTLNFPWAWQVFKSAFIGQPGPIWKWWRINVWGTLIKLKWSILLSLLFTIAGSLIGSTQAEVFSIPADVLDWGYLEEGLVTGIEEIGPIRFFSIEGIGIIFIHNLRAIALASLLGVFSFGVLGIITLVLPFSIIGYFTAIASQTGLSPWTFLLGFVIPHGIVEVPAIILTGALIIHLGLTLVSPNDNYSIGEAWIRTLGDWTRILLLVVIPLLLVAAFLEVYITPLVALEIFSK
ncbi:MAG: stage II sporulation protein M [Anaerolineales bacterium]|nr:stage II sporulation protein M [Anaerolineales bacterium]